MPQQHLLLIASSKLHSDGIAGGELAHATTGQPRRLNHSAVSNCEMQPSLRNHQPPMPLRLTLQRLRHTPMLRPAPLVQTHSPLVPRLLLLAHVRRCTSTPPSSSVFSAAAAPAGRNNGQRRRNACGDRSGSTSIGDVTRVSAAQFCRAYGRLRCSPRSRGALGGCNQGGHASISVVRAAAARYTATLCL